MTKKNGNSITPTDNVILTFDATDLPPAVTVGYTRVRVRVFVPNPMRCFKCQRFGHTKLNCRNHSVCAKCASTGHLDKECESETLKCVNCSADQRPHSSFDKTCPSFTKEKEINAIKATRNISFREARDAYNQTHPAVSYAQKTKTKAPVSAETSLEQMSASQLILLLKLFGLSVVAADVPPTSAAPVAATTLAAPPLAAGSVSPSPSTSTPGDGSDTAAPVAVNEGDGWTLVQHKQRRAGRREALPQPASPGKSSGTATPVGRRSPVKETTVQAALRRNAEDKRARDARKARLLERALEARRSPGAESPSGAGRESARSAPPSPGGPVGRLQIAARSPVGPSPMGPPPPAPPPPPTLRPRDPPPPLPVGSPSGDRLPVTPRSDPRPLEPPPAPARQGKTGLTVEWVTL